MEDIRAAFAAAVKEAWDKKVEIELTRPEEQFGDYSSNVAMQLAKELGKNPREVAEAITNKLQHLSIKSTSVDGPGFINIRLSDDALWKEIESPPKAHKTLVGKVVVVEYSDPNPFKVLHAGHLYTSVIGDAIANLFEAAGATVHRVNFGGDVGLHVAKTMWAIVRSLGGENPDKLAEINEGERSEWMAARYVEGEQAYEAETGAKEEIVGLNKRIYELHTNNDHGSPFAKIYWACRQWSYDYFDKFYARLGTKFEKYYPESATAPLGLLTVKEELAKGVFEESEGAVIFNAEKYGLHTRVFINSEGLPTYEAKDIGLIRAKYNDYKFDKSVVITGNDIVEYMKVVLKAVEQFAPGLAETTVHLTHGIVKLAGGSKMSSRKGNILRAVDILDSTAEAAKAVNAAADEQVTLGAVKYSFLKQRMAGDIIYDPKESVSIEGNSGPYLQYAHARARSILAKVADMSDPADKALEDDERSLARAVSAYSQVLAQATTEMTPHHIATYLYELAQIFNRFYEKNRVVDDPRQAIRLRLVEHYADTLKNGLKLLSIEAPEHL